MPIPSFVSLKNSSFHEQSKTTCSKWNNVRFTRRTWKLFRHGMYNHDNGVKKNNYSSYRSIRIDVVIASGSSSWSLVKSIRRISGGGSRVSRVVTRGKRGRGGGGEYRRRRYRKEERLRWRINNEWMATRVAIPVDDGTSILGRARSNNFRSRSNAYDYQLQYWYIVAAVIILRLNM